MFWLVCALYYMLSIGGLGVTSALASEHLKWPNIVLWSGVGYLIVVTIFLVTRRTQIEFKRGTDWSIVSAGLAISSLIALYVGLRHGTAAQVVTVGAAYPAVTIILAALFLKEKLKPVYIAGVVLVVGGCVLIAAF
jgi:drug/metabolite transporter (DMT)-like permease